MKTVNYARQALALAVLASTLALGCTPSASAVDTEVIGSITASINGEAGAWETLRLPGEGTATASYTRIGPGAIIAIQGHDPDAGSRMHNVLSLELSVMGEGTSARMVVEPTVSHFPEGMSGPSWHASAAEVEWERLELDADGGHASGRFTASLCRQEGVFSEPDLENCRAIEGEFDTRLQAD